MHIYVKIYQHVSGCQQVFGLGKYGENINTICPSFSDLFQLWFTSSVRSGAHWVFLVSAERCGCITTAFDERCGCINTAFDERCGCISTDFEERCGCITSAFDERCGCITTAFDERCGCITTAFEQHEQVYIIYIAPYLHIYLYFYIKVWMQTSFICFSIEYHLKHYRIHLSICFFMNLSFTI